MAQVYVASSRKSVCGSGDGGDTESELDSEMRKRKRKAVEREKIQRGGGKISEETMAFLPLFASQHEPKEASRMCLTFFLSFYCVCFRFLFLS